MHQVFFSFLFFLSVFAVCSLVTDKLSDTSEVKGARREGERRHRGRLRGFYVAVCPVYVSLPLLSSARCIDGGMPVIDGTILPWCSRFNGA